MKLPPYSKWEPGGVEWLADIAYIGMGIIPNLAVPVPCVGGQRAFAAYLDAETAKLDALVGKVEAANERLSEYHTALITAAVTGKIDLRHNPHTIAP